MTPFSQGRDHYGRGDTAWAVMKVKAVRLLDRNFNGGMVKNRAFFAEETTSGEVGRKRSVCNLDVIK
jgi:hypothetical protein